MLLSVVIPAYNEEALIEEYLGKIVAYGDAQPWDYEVLVVDDGSVDRTADLVTAFGREHPEIRLVRLERNRGKGHAVRTGLLAATGEFRGFTDADGSTPISEVERMLSAFRAGADVAIGSRAKPTAGVELRARLHRKFIGRVFNALLRVLVGLRDRHGAPIADTQCGFKWFTAAACEAIFTRSSVDGFAFDVELLYLANRLGFGVEEVAVDWSDRGESSVNLWLDPPKMLWKAMCVPLRHRRVGR